MPKEFLSPADIMSCTCMQARKEIESVNIKKLRAEEEDDLEENERKEETNKLAKGCKDKLHLQ